MEDITKKYDNGEITVIWRPELCRHSANCVKGLPAVFNLAQKPWINVFAADTETITNQVDKCPSGALTWVKNSDH